MWLPLQDRKMLLSLRPCHWPLLQGLSCHPWRASLNNCQSDLLPTAPCQQPPLVHAPSFCPQRQNVNADPTGDPDYNYSTFKERMDMAILYTQLALASFKLFWLIDHRLQSSYSIVHTRYYILSTMYLGHIQLERLVLSFVRTVFL